MTTYKMQTKRDHAKNLFLIVKKGHYDIYIK